MKIVKSVSLDSDLVRKVEELSATQEIPFSTMVNRYVELGVALDSKPLTPEQRQLEEKLAMMNWFLEEMDIPPLTPEQQELIRPKLA